MDDQPDGLIKFGSLPVRVPYDSWYGLFDWLKGDMPLLNSTAFAPLRILALACFLASGLASAQPAAGNTADENVDTSSKPVDDNGEQGGLWTVRLEVNIQHNYSPPMPLEEVTVRGRKPLSAQRRGIDAAEVDVWEAFNDANSDDRFDVTCRSEAPLGTRIPQQICRPSFLDDATSQAARAMLQLDKSGNVGLQQIEVGRAHYLERQLGSELRSLATSDPEVQEKADDYTEQLENYDEARRSRP